jgi:hypothetical protein
MTDCNEPSTPFSTLLANNELGQIHVSEDGVVTLKIQYVSLRLQADAFGALNTLVQQAASSLEDVQAGAPAHSVATAPVHLH